MSFQFQYEAAKAALLTIELFISLESFKYISNNNFLAGMLRGHNAEYIMVSCPCGKYFNNCAIKCLSSLGFAYYSALKYSHNYNNVA